MPMIRPYHGGYDYVTPHLTVDLHVADSDQVLAVGRLLDAVEHLLHHPRDGARVTVIAQHGVGFTCGVAGRPVIGWK